jgi:tetratricopeptide (TPR) repeat protein
LRRALSFDPKFVQARSTLASAYLMQGDVDGCIEQCRQVLAEQPTFGPAYNNLCLAYMQLEDYDQAIENCDLAIKYGYEMPQNILEELNPHRKE